MAGHAGMVDAAHASRYHWRQAGAGVADDRDRDIFTGDLAGGPWVALAVG
jgi:hypothetical protein